MYGTNFKIPLVDIGFHYHSFTIFGLYALSLIFIKPGRFFGKRIDILFEDSFKEKLIIELKIGNLQRNALWQVMEYEGHILSEKDPGARVMIVANRIPLNLKKAMEHRGIEYKEISINQSMVFLEKSDAKLLEAIIGQIQVSPSPVPPGEETELPSESIIGKVTDVKSKKDSKERFEFWFRRRDENWFQYRNTKDPKGYPVNLLIYDRKYTIGFHNTKSCIWFAALLERNGYCTDKLFIDSTFIIVK